MFIEPASSKDSLRSSGAKQTRCGYDCRKTFRSTGARFVLKLVCYKHSAPPEPEHYLVVALPRCVFRVKFSLAFRLLP